jgi:hypothetical protein
MSVKTKRRNESFLIAGLLLLISTQGPAEAGSRSQQKNAQLKDVGRIVGRVQVEGHFEKPRPLKVYKNRDFCGPQVSNESLLVSREGGVQNAVVIIPKARDDKSAILPGNLGLDNRNCAFVPHVQIAPVGSELLLLNSDPILHDVHARLGSETLFNEGLPTWRQVKKRLARTGIVTIQCDVLHTWMSAYVVVTASRYFAVTDEKGEFVIEAVPAGNYEIEAWHEKLGRHRKRVSVTEKSTLRIDFVYGLGKTGT